ncbi:ribosomal protein L3 domain containing protein [Babesia divergens]|uniref:Large ribosomal subunit protein uL3c n=1 Tax=Babesia divergens TaxID=32595 RepID=A0AAD9GDA4_BABDI|nr:ribosomal protein L3 domain containing protein [Babesia divergens]
MRYYVYKLIVIAIAKLALLPLSLSIHLADELALCRTGITSFRTKHRNTSSSFVNSDGIQFCGRKNALRMALEKEALPSDFTLTPRDRVVIAKDPFDPRPYLWNVRWPETERKIELRAIKYHVGQIWSPDGHVETVTALKVLPCTICEFMDFGYALVSYGKPMWERRWNRRTELGKLIKNCSNFADMIPVKLQPPQDYVLGQILDVSAFAGCTYVKVTGITKGKGFAGVIKRHGFSRGPMSHGSKHHRKPGSIGASTTPGCVKPGKRMAGRMGGKRCSFRKLRVLGINPETSLMYVKALVAGAKGSYVSVTSDMQSPRPDNILK